MYSDWDGIIDEDLDEYDFKQQAAWRRKLKRNCQGGPDCGCAWCEPEPEEEYETEVNEQDE
jgi:hypothetical protein